MFTFRAMNTDVSVTVGSGDEASVAARVAATFAQAEQRFSRFRADSELSALNRARGPMVVSPELFAALVRARRYVDLTDGVFDPGIGATLAALGYDRSFAPGALDRASVHRTPRPGSFLDVALDPRTRSVERAEHVQIDLGGMIKGATVDAAAIHLGGCGAIDAGGDAVLCGTPPIGGPWLVDIEHPEQPSRTLATLAVENAAVATSAPNRRRWRLGEDVAHHLIDPRTQRSAHTDLLQATVIAASAELADVLAKTAFLLGSRAAPGLLERCCAGGVLVPQDGAPIFVGALRVQEVCRA